VKSPYIPDLATISRIITENEAEDIKTFELSLNGSELAYAPGQFAMLSVFGVGECPIGIASSPTQSDIVQFTVKKAGVVTAALHECEEGATIGVRGPYGNGWPMRHLENRNLVIIGGGFAFTTLRSLAHYILHSSNRDRYHNVAIIYGARSPGELIYKRDLEAWSQRGDVALTVTVDKGDSEWKGKEGYVPTITKQVAPSAEEAIALVCGPPIMIKFTIPVLKELGFSSQDILLSLEMRMKCGIGKCGRCNVGHRYVCLDGPVFSLAQLEELPKEY